MDLPEGASFSDNDEKNELDPNDPHRALANINLEDEFFTFPTSSEHQLGFENSLDYVNSTKLESSINKSKTQHKKKENKSELLMDKEKKKKDKKQKHKRSKCDLIESNEIKMKKNKKKSSKVDDDNFIK